MQPTDPQAYQVVEPAEKAVSDYLKQHYPHLNAVATASDKRVSRRVFGTDELEAANPDRHAKVMKPLCDLCAQKGIIDVPKLLIAKSPVQNASVTSEGSLIVSQGLLETLSVDEMKAVITHELDHYRKREHDSTIYHAVTFIADFLFGLFAGRKIDHAIDHTNVKFLNDHEWARKSLSHTLPALGLHYIVAAPSHAFFKRSSEYKADLEGAHTVGFDNMIGVLKFFDEMYDSRQDKTPKTLVTKVKDNGILGNITAILFPFADHPTFKQRIERLEEERAKNPETRVTSAQLQENLQNAPSSPSVH